MLESYKNFKHDKKQNGQARIQEFMLEGAPPPWIRAWSFKTDHIRDK